MLLVTSSRTSSIMADKKFKWQIYCDFSHFTSIIWPCGRNNMNIFACILPKFVVHVTNDQFSNKFDNGWKKIKWPIYCDVSHFTSIIWPCGCDNLKSFSCILRNLFVMYVAKDQFSDKFNNGWKKPKWPIYFDFLHFTSIIWPCGRNNTKFFIYPAQFCYVCNTNKQLSDKLNNSWKKSKWPIYCTFLHFTSIIWPCGWDKFKFNNGGGLYIVECACSCFNLKS